MKIVLVTQWYPPEQAPIGYMIQELAEALDKAGHEVRVITGFPNHPSGILFNGYKKSWCIKERLYRHGELWRMYLYTSPNPNKFQRILSFCTFTLTSAWAALTSPRFDLLFGVFQPLSVGISLPIVARIRGARLILNVQDLHPDALVELGLIRNTILIRILKWIESFGYRSSDGLAVICNQFSVHCESKGVDRSKMAVIPNWIDLSEITPVSRDNDFRNSIGLSTNHFVILFAGTVGLVAGAEVILQTALRLKDSSSDIRFVFVGEGPAVAELKEFARENCLTNVLFLPFQPRENLSQVQAIADISIVTMRKGKGRASVPSKVLGYMAAAKPIIAAVDPDSETASLICSAKCGIVVSPEDPLALSEKIIALRLDSNLMQNYGLNGRRYLENNYQKEAVLANYVRFFERIASKK